VSSTRPTPANDSQIRLATRADVETLCELRLAIFQEIGKSVARQEPAFLAACRTAYEALFDEARGVAWLAETDADEAVATLTLLFHTRMPSPARLGTGEGYVVGVYTIPAWRGRGLATALLDLAIEESRRRGMTRIRLHATEMGRRVYAARGFQPRQDAMDLNL
jgi:GNAT superfamily N-acetyltransferase